MTTTHRSLSICPCCRFIFLTFILGSTNTYGLWGTDFFKQAAGTQYILIEIQTCPHCGYSGYEEDFKERKVTKELKEFVKHNIRPHARCKMLPIWKKYEFAALIAIRRGDPNREVAELYLRGAWCCQLNEEKVGERYYRFKAIEYFQNAFKANETLKEEKAIYTYLMGELYRRIGDVEHMVLWFDRVKGTIGEDEGLKWLMDLAIQQKTHPKNFFTWEDLYRIQSTTIH
ncbi:MAG: DUF2225 domain-containing protein [Thermodesulfobacteriota bacterium]